MLFLLIFLAKVFQTHPFGVAIMDADDDGDLDCLTAVRTKFDQSGPAADYVWILPGVNGHTKQNITVHFEKGESPDRASAYVNDATDQRVEARAIYADYKTCAVLSLPYNQDTHCILWVTDEAKDNVPSKCKDQFLNNCYKEVLTYDKETCSQV